MKKFFVIIFEVIIILCLLLILLVKVCVKQRESNQKLISTKIGSTEVIAKKAEFNNKSSFLWTQAIVEPSSKTSTRESFFPQRTILLIQEKNFSELTRLRNKKTPIKTTNTEFLWTNVKVNTYGDSETRETFLSKRNTLLKQEKKLSYVYK